MTVDRNSCRKESNEIIFFSKSEKKLVLILIKKYTLYYVVSIKDALLKQSVDTIGIKLYEIRKSAK